MEMYNLLANKGVISPAFQYSEKFRTARFSL